MFHNFIVFCWVEGVGAWMLNGATRVKVRSHIAVLDDLHCTRKEN